VRHHSSRVITTEFSIRRWNLISGPLGSSLHCSLNSLSLIVSSSSTTMVNYNDPDQIDRLTNYRNAQVWLPLELRSTLTPWFIRHLYLLDSFSGKVSFVLFQLAFAPVSDFDIYSSGNEPF